MALMQIKTGQIGDGEVKRNDLNTTTTGSAVIAKAIAGAGITFSSTGVDAGTGDVTISASGAFGYISNYGAETNATGWTASGANFTASRTTTGGEVLKGTASLKLTANGSQAVNDYIYHSFTLDAGDTNSLLAAQFYFKGISNYDSDDCHIVLHDGTNEIIPSITSIPGGAGFFEATWVSTSATSYQIRFKAKVTTAFSLVVDDVFVGAKEIVRGAAIGYYGSYTPTITATSNPTKGTTVKDTAHIWRRGKIAIIAYDYNQTATGSAGSGDYQWSMPSGLTIDLNYTPDEANGSEFRGNIGDGVVNDAGASSALHVTAHAYDSTHFKILLSSGAGQSMGSSSFSLANTGLNISLILQVPITEWDEAITLQNNKVEYVSNSSTNDGDDTTSYATGLNGSVIPAVTGAYKKQVEFATPIQQGDDIEVQADWDAQGIWNRWEDQGYDNVTGKTGPTWEYVSGSKTKINVWMRGSQYARFQNSTANFRSYTQENSAGSRWRVRKSSNPLAVESPNIVEEVNVSYVVSGDGGTATSGSEADLSLNTMDNPKGYGWITGPSSNAITLAPGTYSFIARQNFYNTAATMLHIKNTTDSIYIASATGYMVVAANVGGDLVAMGQAVLTGTKTIKLRYEVQSTQSGNGLGPDAAFTPDNTFTNLKIQRLGP